ncbi:MAG TPA: hypothetical protein VFA76_13995 [Terriglobales bacterium]|nr:hypothetical protein [Terriglobales bacterium]
MATQESTVVSSSRRTAQEILEDVAQSGQSELHRSSRALGFSGLAGGLLGPRANNELKKDRPAPPIPPDQEPRSPVEEPPDGPQPEPPAPVREPDPTLPTRL